MHHAVYCLEQVACFQVNHACFGPVLLLQELGKSLSYVRAVTCVCVESNACLPQQLCTCGSCFSVLLC